MTMTQEKGENHWYKILTYTKSEINRRNGDSISDSRKTNSSKMEAVSHILV